MDIISGTADITWRDIPEIEDTITDVARRTAALWYAKGWQEGRASGYRECAAHQDQQLDEQIRAALGAAGHTHLDRQRRQLAGDKRTRQLRAAARRRDDWPGLDNMDSQEREVAYQSILATWDTP
jgi:hypothetical protein